MIEKKTIIDQIEVTRTGHIQVRFGLLLIEDGAELDCKWHRTAIEPGADANAQIAMVNASLLTLGKAAIDDKQTVTLMKIVEVVHSPENVVSYRHQIEELKKKQK